MLAELTPPVQEKPGVSNLHQERSFGPKADSRPSQPIRRGNKLKSNRKTRRIVAIGSRRVFLKVLDAATDILIKDARVCRTSPQRTPSWSEWILTGPRGVPTITP
jgi:hypothetical protein